MAAENDGTAFAVVIAKQLYGGLGHNPFNPAMIGYVVLLISARVAAIFCLRNLRIAASVPHAVKAARIICNRVPRWMVVLGTAFAVVIAKQLYGGLGHNPFNPAMIGYPMRRLFISPPLAVWPLKMTCSASIKPGT
jgi:Na+-translocating ferredoxin:NAD+ oxidoreductase RnfD subunit